MAEDYRVKIGKGECMITRVVDNNIMCTPPPTQPDHDPQKSTEYPRVAVSEIMNLS